MGSAKKTVFILGSGFSKAVADYPTLSTLSTNIEKTLLKRQGKEKAAAFILKNAPKPVRDNVEDLMTFFSQNHPWLSLVQQHEYKAAYYYLIDIIQEAMRGCDRIEPCEDRRKTIAGSIVKYWHKWESKVITFNWDTLVEQVFEGTCQRKSIKLERCGLYDERIDILEISSREDLPIEDTSGITKATYDSQSMQLSISVPDHNVSEDTVRQAVVDEGVHLSVEFMPKIRDAIREFKQYLICKSLYTIPLQNVLNRNGKAEDYRSELESTFSLIKLHGSLNWLVPAREDYSNAPMFWRRNSWFDENIEKSTGFASQGLMPLLVPPVMDKSAFYVHDNIRVQWEKARDAIQSAEHLVFFGYSLPATDLTTNFLFKSCMPGQLKKITVIDHGEADDRANNTIRERFRSVFGVCEDKLHVRNAAVEGNSSLEILQKICNL